MLSLFEFPVPDLPVSETGVQIREIHERAAQALADAHLQQAYSSSTLRLYTKRLEAVAEVPGFEWLRERAHALKREVIEHLDFYLDQFATAAERRGAKVHWTETAEDARRTVIEIARQAGAREIVKAKTMVSEEIELNHALEAAGIRLFRLSCLFYRRVQRIEGAPKRSGIHCPEPSTGNGRPSLDRARP